MAQRKRKGEGRIRDVKKIVEAPSPYQRERKGKVGQQPMTFDWDKFRNMCRMHCTLEEIADVFDCSPDTVETVCREIYDMKFSELFSIWKHGGKASLRSKIYRQAMEGDTRLLLHLARHSLGQIDEVKHKVSMEQSDGVQEEGKASFPITIRILEKPSGSPNPESKS